MSMSRNLDTARPDDFADLRNPSDTSAMRFAAGALLFGILVASTTLYLKTMEAAASILLH